MSLPVGIQPAYFCVGNRRARRPPVTIPAKNAAPKALIHSGEPTRFSPTSLSCPTPGSLPASAEVSVQAPSTELSKSQLRVKVIGFVRPQRV
jgi:hypothetical protein